MSLKHVNSETWNVVTSLMTFLRELRITEAEAFYDDHDEPENFIDRMKRGQKDY